jgi:hypothetical protein
VRQQVLLQYRFLENAIIYSGLLPDFSDFEPRWKERGFFCCTPIQTATGFHPFSCTRGTGVHFLE